MIAKSARLPGDEFRAGSYRAARTPYFVLKAKRGAGRNGRIGVVVGKSVHKTATRRNFWKRQAKAGLLRARGAGGAAGMAGKDFLMVLSPKVNELTRKQFQEVLTRSVRTIL